MINVTSGDKSMWCRQRKCYNVSTIYLYIGSTVISTLQGTYIKTLRVACVTSESYYNDLYWHVTKLQNDSNKVYFLSSLMFYVKRTMFLPNK